MPYEDDKRDNYLMKEDHQERKERWAREREEAKKKPVIIFG
jgi:hypothetical protein